METGRVAFGWPVFFFYTNSTVKNRLILYILHIVILGYSAKLLVVLIEAQVTASDPLSTAWFTDPTHKYVKEANALIEKNLNEEKSTGIISELVSHTGEPVKPSQKYMKDSFRYRGTLEENVTPITPSMIWGDDADEVTNPHLDLLPG